MNISGSHISNLSHYNHHLLWVGIQSKAVDEARPLKKVRLHSFCPGGRNHVYFEFGKENKDSNASKETKQCLGAICGIRELQFSNADVVQ